MREQSLCLNARKGVVFRTIEFCEALGQSLYFSDLWSSLRQAANEGSL